MAHLKPVEQRSTFHATVQGMAKNFYGQELSILDTIAHHPGILRMQVAVEDAMMREISIPLHLKTLLNLRAAQTIGCHFCMDIGTSNAALMEVPQAKVDGLAQWRQSEAFSPAERAALAYCDAVSTTPVQDTAAIVGELKQHFSEAQIVEIASIVAWEHYRARMNHGLGYGVQGFCKMRSIKPVEQALIPEAVNA